MTEKMSESEWLAYTGEPGFLHDQLYFHSVGDSHRKRRLLGCAFCEQVAVYFQETKGVVTALQVAQSHAEGLASDAELATAYEFVREYIDSYPKPWDHSDVTLQPFELGFRFSAGCRESRG